MARVTLTGPLADGLRSRLPAALEAARVELEAKASALVAEARASWPVKSGRSRDSLDLDVDVDPGSLRVTVTIRPVDYARDIVTTDGRSPYDELLVEPARRLVEELARELPRRLGTTLTEG